jgi:bacteriorhodopsin
MRFVLPVLGVVLALVGALWTLQGAGVLPGSVMSGSKFWLVVGLVLLVAGIWLLVRSLRRRPSTPST